MEAPTVPEDAVKCKVKAGDQEGSSSGLSFMTKERENLDLQWVETGRVNLLATHKRKILGGDELDDAILSFTQKLIKKQFPAIDGLQNTLLQGKKLVSTSAQQRLQVIHSRGNHWIIASTVHDEGSGKVLIYDSLYNDVDVGTQLII